MTEFICPPQVIDKFNEIACDCMGDAAPYCEAACPMHTDVQGYVDLIAEKKPAEALALIREKLFLPATLGRICSHPCEDKCKRGEMKHPLSVAALKRFAADNYDNAEKWDLAIAPDTGKRIAIIGAGPAGAQAAVDLRKKGHEVTIYDRLPVVGGMLRVGIPEYRLPRDIIDFEYSLLDKIGVKLNLGVEIGNDIPFEQLQQDYDAVLIAAGAHKSIVIPVEGHDLEGVINAVDFLREVSLTGKYDTGNKIVVIGGGNVAIDVARSARRTGASEVHLVCLENPEEMPAHSWEIEEAREEGVNIHAGFGPESILGVDGKATGFKAKKCTSVFDESGKFNPAYDENEKLLFEDVDNVIFAVGQSVETPFIPEGMLATARGGRLVVDPATLQTNTHTIFAAGDITGGSVIAIEAMAEGRKAAESIDRFLTGRDLYENREHEGSYDTILETTIDPDEPNIARLETTKIPADKRVTSFTEVDRGFSEEQAVEEASRCLKCECKLCVKECEMLEQYTEYPGQLFKDIIRSDKVDPMIPFSCNMCLQCTLVCPKEFRLMDRFMDMRLQMVAKNNGKSPIKGHGAIDIHQKLGFSRFFNTTKSVNSGQPTKRVFIPGCSLPSYNPQLVEQILHHLQNKLPGTGAILKCCGKPTKALGQKEQFIQRYSELQAEIDRLGAEEIIVACQSCYLTIKEYSPNQKVRSLWEVLPEIGLPDGAAGIGKDSDITIAVHDSCPTRDVPEIHDGIRWVMNELGYTAEEPPHTKEHTRCCGFGGMVVPANPQLALKVMKRRTGEVDSDYMVTYCAACRESMVRGGKKAVHILDLIFSPAWTSKSEFPGIPANPLKSWINRYRSKKKILQAG